VNRSGPTRRFQPASGAANWRPTTHALPGPTSRNAFGVPVVRRSTWANRIAARRAPGRRHWDWLDRILVHPATIRRTAVPSLNWTVALTMNPGATVTNRIHAAAPHAPFASTARTHLIQPPLFSVTQIRPEFVRTIDRARPVTSDRTIVTQRQQRTVHTASHESTLITRLTARRERREAANSTVPTSTMHSLPSPAPASPAASRVLAHRRPPAQPEPPTPLRHPAPSPHDIGDAMRMSPPQIDLQSLADQVIRTIDQRVVAARERLGGQ
jgi:hypothetical protein